MQTAVGRTKIEPNGQRVCLRGGEDDGRITHNDCRTGPTADCFRRTGPVYACLLERSGFELPVLFLKLRDDTSQ